MLMLSVPKYDKKDKEDKNSHEINDDDEFVRLME